MDEMRRRWLWLSSVEGLGLKRFYKLLADYEDPRAVWDSLGPAMRPVLGDAVYRKLVVVRSEAYIDELIAKLDKLHIHVVTRVDDEYPPLLSAIYDPPPTLFVRGRRDLAVNKAFAIVGSRRCTRDGQRAAREYAQLLSQSGVCVVSGAARGIDTYAHAGALAAMGEAGKLAGADSFAGADGFAGADSFARADSFAGLSGIGDIRASGGSNASGGAGPAPTIAVLGCGVDIVYPPENDKLLSNILSTGGSIISEYMPGTPPLATHFPARNRIISGMSRGVLLVEGAKGSGAMITIDFALEQGRDVFVVPGGVFAPQSVAPNGLLRDGAYPALDGYDILTHYGWGERPGMTPPKRENVQLDMNESRVVSMLSEGETGFDELLSGMGIQTHELNSLLTMLELRGIIGKAAGRQYHLT